MSREFKIYRVPEKDTSEQLWHRIPHPSDARLTLEDKARPRYTYKKLCYMADSEINGKTARCMAYVSGEIDTETAEMMLRQNFEAAFDRLERQDVLDSVPHQQEGPEKHA